MAKRILIKPIISEKAERETEKHNKYSFVVDRKANKIEIQKAIEKRYDVKVTAVNIMVMPGKSKSRYTRAGAIQGLRPAYKKAVVSIAENDIIDLYSGI